MADDGYTIEANRLGSIYSLTVQSPKGELEFCGWSDLTRIHRAVTAHVTH